MDDNEKSKKKFVLDRSSIKKDRKRFHPTLDEHLQQHDLIISYIEKEMEKKIARNERGVKKLASIKKMVKKLKKDARYVKRNNSKTKNNISGLKKKYKITREMEKFLGVKNGSRLSRHEVTCAICVYANSKDNETRQEMIRWRYLNPGGKRNLQNPFDKTSIIPDSKLATLLRYEEYKNQVRRNKITKRVVDKHTKKTNVIVVTKPDLYYYTIQRLIGIHFLLD